MAPVSSCCGTKRGGAGGQEALAAGGGAAITSIEAVAVACTVMAPASCRSRYVCGLDNKARTVMEQLMPIAVH
jgi:hypothetical protein